MDYYNFDSEVIESLNLLRPPVKRATGIANRDFSVYYSNNNRNLQVLKEFGHKFKNKCENKKYFQQRRHEDSSTSLILKKTSETQVLKQYSVVSYTSLHCQEQATFSQPKAPIVKEKPLIKVTVIPKSDLNSAPKLFRKQRIVSKTIHSTSSNHENSIHTKNVYLVVAGRKKDKFYEIKTTGSVKFEKETIKDEVGHLCHFKDFIKSLNMERKKKKNKKDANRNETQANVCETRDIEHACKCSPAGSEVSVHEVRPGRSRVRIFGRIGLTKNDKYVLKCQATVDDKPVPTSALQKQPSDCSLAVCSRNAETSTFRRTSAPMSGRDECKTNIREEEPMRFRRTRNNRVEEIEPEEKEPMLWRNTGSLCVKGNNDRDKRPEACWKTNDAASEEESDDDIGEPPIRNLRDVLMQTKGRSNAVNELLINIQNKHRISNQSQATQVNFNKTDGTVNKMNAYHNEPIKICNCSNNDDPLIETIDDSQHCPATLKSCQSPLVIISVFPKQNNNKADVVKTIQCAHVDNKLAMREYPVNKAETGHKISNNYERGAENYVNKTDKDHELRSLSPTGRKMKFKVNKIVETRHTKSITRNDVTKLGKKLSKKGAMSPKQPMRKQESLSTGDTDVKKYKTSPSRSVRAKSPPPSPKKEPQNKNFSRNSQYSKTKAKEPKKVDVGINTEHQKTKKALVDSYTSKMTEHLNGNKEGPSKALSTVSVNIDSEHEYYDVTFRQGKINTDVNVRRTMKEASVQKEKNEDVNKCFQNTCKNNKKSSKNKKSFVVNQDDLEKDTPKLAVRDSLEIGLRREVKVIKVTQTPRPNKQPAANNNDMEFLAPIKHFTGDDCTICDPLERDREIRELLGVEERRNNSHFNDSKDRIIAFGNHISRRCFYNKQCEQLFLTGFAFNQPLTPCDCINDNDCNDANCEDSDFKLHHDDDSDDNEEALPRNNTINKSNKSMQHNTTEQNNKRRSTNIMTDDNDNFKEKSRHRTISKKSYVNEQREKAENNTNNVDCQCKGTQLRGKNVDCQCKNVSTQHKSMNREEDSEMIEDSCPCLDDTDRCDIPVCDKFNTKNNQEEPIKTAYERKMTNAKQDDLSNNNSNVTSLYQQLTLNRNIQIFLQVEQFAKQKPIVLSKKQYNKIKKTIQRTILAREKSKRCVCNRSIVSISPKNGELDRAHSNRESRILQSIRESKKSKKSSQIDEKPVETVVLYSNEVRGSVKDKKSPKVIVKRAASSLEVRNTSISYWKHDVTFSSTQMGSIGSSSIANRNQHSLETIFRGHKKSLTPNLGTSAFSLLSEARISESQSMKFSPEPKTKKPFLKRLMSCLVLRSRVSEKIPIPVVSPKTANSSVDSYHVSTSFGGIEMTSSIYDTSVSFCSDHSIHPLSSKFKRSFLSSVRDFLTSRKS